MHIDDMKWESAPAWATHIIGWIGEPENCHWAQEIDGRYFPAEQRRDQAYSFYITTDDDDDDDGWEIVEERPNAYSAA